eukprot:1654383-Rhodomonas_salina.2
MRRIDDLCNGTMRECRKCHRILAVSEFSQVPRRHVCKLCKSRQYINKKGIPRNWEQKLLHKVQWDASYLYDCPHRLHVHEVAGLPKTDDVKAGDPKARIVPIDTRTSIARYNAVIVCGHVSDCLRSCFKSGDHAMYSRILCEKYPAASKPIEVVGI